MRYSRVVELEIHSEIFKRSGMVVAPGSDRFDSYGYGSDNTHYTHVNVAVRLPSIA